MALFRHHHPERDTMSWSGLAQDTGIGNGTAQRINEMTSDASLSTIEAVALRYGLEAWHVLVPGLDPKNPPVFLMTDSERKLYDSLAKSALAVTRKHLEHLGRDRPKWNGNR
jgi:hypothetical protein